MYLQDQSIQKINYWILKKTSLQLSISASAVFLAEISVRSPRKWFMFIIKTYIFWSQKRIPKPCCLIIKTEANLRVFYTLTLESSYWVRSTRRWFIVITKQYVKDKVSRLLCFMISGRRKTGSDLEVLLTELLHNVFHLRVFFALPPSRYTGFGQPGDYLLLIKNSISWTRNSKLL